ncbi:unnamed protein product [Rotaria sp. Silwood2]|nr:unnamed protein product [Rotaria sp. Silwood2]
MNQSDIHLLDLPNEILLIILKKLDNIDVLYSLFGINNKRIDILVEDDVFTSILNFTRISSITDVKFDRFCNSILPQINQSIKKLILETTSMEHILVGNYSNLTSLELFNFGQIVYRHLTDNSVFRHFFKYQITELVLHNNDEYSTKTSLDTYTRDVYAHIMVLFQHLKHLTVVASSINEYPPLSLLRLPPTTYFSSILTVLNINVLEFSDCLSLLDGRLKQLTTFIVQVGYIFYYPWIPHNVDVLQNLKCFSLTSYHVTCHYERSVFPLLRRITNLERLTLYLCVRNDYSFVNDTHLNDEILLYMPQLHTFIFYISTETVVCDLIHPKSNDDMQKPFINTKYGQMAYITESFYMFDNMCHIYSLPFAFTHLRRIGNKFPNIVFDNVTHLVAYDITPMKHEFFMRISQDFPVLKCLSIQNRMYQSSNRDEFMCDNYAAYSIIEYPYLISLDFMCAHMDYVLQFLLETKTQLPHLTELKVKYRHLTAVTMKFTRDGTRRNCSKVKRLIFEKPARFSEDIYQYFSSL